MDIKTPVYLVLNCETCGCDEINDVDGETLMLVQGYKPYDTATLGLDTVRAINERESLINIMKAARPLASMKTWTGLVEDLNVALQAYDKLEETI